MPYIQREKKKNLAKDMGRRENQRQPKCEPEKRKARPRGGQTEKKKRPPLAIASGGKVRVLGRRQKRKN